MDERLTAPAQEDRPRPPWGALDAFPVAFVAAATTFAVVAAAGTFLAEGTGILVGGLVFEAALAAATLLWVRLRYPGSTSDLGIPGRSPGAGVVFGGVAGLILFAVTVFLVAPALFALLGALMGEPVTPPRQEVLPRDPGVGQVAFGAVVAVVAAPLGEELFFRGLLFGGLRRRFRFAVAAGVSSAVFAAVHVILLLMPLMFVVGLGLAWIYEHRRSLPAAIAAHAAFNVVGFALLARSAT